MTDAAASKPQAERLTRPRVERLDAVLGVPFPRPRRRVRARRGLHGRRRVGRAGGARLVRRRHEARPRRSRPHPLSAAARAHDAVRDVRDQAARARAHGRVAPVDPPPHGERQRILDALFRRHRRRAAHAADGMAPAVGRQPARQRGVPAGRRRARHCRRPKRRCRTREAAVRRRGWRPASPASRRARICRCRPTPRPTGRPTSTTCSTFSSCGWTTTRRKRFARTPPSSASRSSPSGCRSSGRPSPTTAAARCACRESKWPW